MSMRVACLLLLQASVAMHSASDALYQDDALHFKLRYPADLVNQTDPTKIAAALKQETDPEKRRKMACVTAPLVALKQKGPLFDLLMILKMDMTCLGEPLTPASLPAFTRGEVQQSLARHPGAVVVAQHAYKLGGRDTYLIQSTVDESGKAAGRTLYAASICSLLERNVVCWQALSYDAATERELEQESLSFAGLAAEPLVPSAFVRP